VVDPVDAGRHRDEIIEVVLASLPDLHRTRVWRPRVAGPGAAPSVRHETSSPSSSPVSRQARMIWKNASEPAP
jgi:hypothetical protein